MTKSAIANLSDERTRGDYAALVREAATGDRDAMERLLTRAQEAAYRFSRLVCGHPEDAEDVMQDALLKTFRYVGRIEEPESFRTWLFTTVRNACLMKRRRRVGEPPVLVSLDAPPTSDEGRRQRVDVADDQPPADQQMIDAWIGRRLRAALGRIPAPYRAIVVMREMEGLSTREVAQVTGLSEANVKTRLHRARVMLRQELERP